MSPVVWNAQSTHISTPITLLPECRLLNQVGLVGAVNDALAECLSDPRVRAVSADLQRALVGPQTCHALIHMFLPPAAADSASSSAASAASAAAAAAGDASGGRPSPGPSECSGRRAAFLRSLCLDFNCLHDSGTAVLASALPSLPALRALSLGFNDIGDQGARALAAALPRSRIERVDLRHNRVGAEGARMLAAAIPAPSALRSISFLHNRLGAGVRSGIASLRLRFQRKPGLALTSACRPRSLHLSPPLRA